MEHQTIPLDGREYVIVPRADYDQLAGGTARESGVPAATLNRIL